MKNKGRLLTLLLKRYPSRMNPCLLQNVLQNTLGSEAVTVYPIEISTLMNSHNLNSNLFAFKIKIVRHMNAFAV